VEQTARRAELDEAPREPGAVVGLDRVVADGRQDIVPV